MLNIRKEQVEQITATMGEAYHRRLAQFFREAAPGATAQLDDAALIDLVAKGVAKAARYGIENASAIVRFIGLMVTISPSFDEIPEVRTYLERKDLQADFKVHLLADLLAQVFHARAR